jgi:chromate transporter
MEKQSKLKRFLDLYFTFVKIGAFTIGGGLAMMPMMQKELIDKKHWMTEEDLIDYYAVGQSTPGMIAVNVSTFVGYNQLGILGGIVATLGMVSPSIIIITILAGLINSIDEYPMVQKALRGINVAVAALFTSVIVKFAKKTIKKPLHVLLMLISFTLVYFFKVQSFWIILAAILCGVVITSVNIKKAAKEVVQNYVADSKTVTDATETSEEE